MKKVTLEEMIEKHGGRENLVPVAFIKQQIFYATRGVQPVFIWQKEGHPGYITAWYLASESSEVVKEWHKTKPPKER